MFRSPDSNVSEGHEMMKQGRFVMLNVMFLPHDKAGEICAATTVLDTAKESSILLI